MKTFCKMHAAKFHFAWQVMSGLHRPAAFSHRRRWQLPQLFFVFCNVIQCHSSSSCCFLNRELHGDRYLYPSPTVPETLIPIPTPIPASSFNFVSIPIRPCIQLSPSPSPSPFPSGLADSKWRSKQCHVIRDYASISSK